MIKYIMAIIAIALNVSAAKINWGEVETYPHECTETPCQYCDYDAYLATHGMEVIYPERLADMPEVVPVKKATPPIPPPQRLARTVPPEIAAMVISNAPPGAVISYRYHRALPYDPTHSYKRGDVVIDADGTPYVVIMNVFPCCDPPGKDDSPSRPSAAPPSRTCGASPPQPPKPSAMFFRAINQPLTNAPARIIQPLAPESLHE